MRFKSVGNKGDRIMTVIVNNDVNNTTLRQGSPCFMDLTPAIPDPRGGAGVVTPEGLASAQQVFFAGLNTGADSVPGGDCLFGQYAESIVYGFYDYCRVLLSTRATSTDVWASYAAVALGDIMSFVTTSGVQAVQRSAAGSASNQGWWINAAQSLVSATTQASSVTTPTFGNSTAYVTQLRVRVAALA